MANKRKPNAVHKLNGTLRKDRHGDDGGIEFSGAVPTPPKILKGEALKEWKRVVPELKKIGLLTLFDRMVLCQYCVLTAEFFASQTAGEPLSAAWHNQYKLIQQELGFTPSSRSSLKLPGAKKQKTGGVLRGAM